jgi:hypothetical protein
MGLPFKNAGMKKSPKLAKNPVGPSKPKGGGVAGGNMSGLATGLAMARPKKMGRVAGMKNKMFGGGM